MITGTTSFPPPIIKSFNRMLLSTHIFKHDAEYLGQIAEALEMAINSNKFKKFPSTVEKLKKKYEKFMEIYERTKVEERNMQEKKGSKAHAPFYRIKLSNPNDRKISDRLDERRLRFQRKHRKHNQIPKT